MTIMEAEARTRAAGVPIAVPSNGQVWQVNTEFLGRFHI